MNKTLGVIPAKFQVPELHEGHRGLIEFVASLHETVVIILGSAPFPTPKNIYSFAIRKKMVEQAYPGVKIVELKDRRSNLEWSKALDETILAFGEEATLYGSRDSFARYYETARFPVYEVPEFGTHNGTSIRAQMKDYVGDSSEFRRGVAHGFLLRQEHVRPAVDTAILRRETGEVLLGAHETDEGKLRFIGGGLEEQDESLEAAAKRETFEETSGIEVSDPRYIGSKKIDDWRYRDTGATTTTALFAADYLFGAPSPKDDVVKLQWIPLAQLMEVLVEEHRPLGEMLRAWLKAHA